MISISLDNESCMPYKKHKWDGGWDLRSNNEDFILLVGSNVKVSTGVKVAIPPRHIGLVVPRSGLGTKFRVGLANTVGIIDSDYRGEIFVCLTNSGLEDVEIKKYSRFCQLIIVPVNLESLRVVDELQSTERGEDGFGSTGHE